MQNSIFSNRFTRNSYFFTAVQAQVEIGDVKYLRI